MTRNRKSKPNIETLQYIQSMLRELRLMASTERCAMTAYLIGMAYIEIGDVIRDVAQPASKREAA